MSFTSQNIFKKWQKSVTEERCTCQEHYFQESKKKRILKLELFKKERNEELLSRDYGTQ